jgi:hypothetical protein
MEKYEFAATKQKADYYGIFFVVEALCRAR